jgi:uncharacterized membrane protein YeaQ/YmgE (transglycosylase-associated protein family)
LLGIDTLPIPVPVPVTAFAALKKSLTPDTGYVIAVAFLIGLVAGFVAKALAPDDDKKGALGWIGAVVGGGIAAVAALTAAIPTDAVKFIGQCLIAGYAGKTFLEAMKAKAIAGTRQARLRSIGRAAEDLSSLLQAGMQQAGDVTRAREISSEIERIAKKED